MNTHKLSDNSCVILNNSQERYIYIGIEPATIA